MTRAPLPPAPLGTLDFSDFVRNFSGFRVGGSQNPLGNFLRFFGVSGFWVCRWSERSQGKSQNNLVGQYFLCGPWYSVHGPHALARQSPKNLLRLFCCLENCFYFLRLFFKGSPKIPFKTKPREVIFIF